LSALLTPSGSVSARIQATIVYEIQGGYGSGICLIFYFSLSSIYCVPPGGVNQGCGSGFELDPDSMALWIRIGNPDPGSGSRGKKMEKNKYGTFLVDFI
jgi:hypothetical protein